MFKKIQNNGAIFIAWMLALSLFALPISTSVKIICLIIAMISIVITPEYMQALRQSLSMRWCQVAILLFIFVLCSCLWSHANFHSQKFVLEKYTKLLYLPILAVGFKDKLARKLGIHAFLFAMLVICFLCLVKFFHWIDWPWGRDLYRYDPGSVFLNHIMTSYMVSFAAYISGVYFLDSSSNLSLGRKYKIMYLVLFCIFTAQILIINTGRTGYIMYALLMGVLAIQYLTWRKILLAFVMLCALFSLSYNYSENIHTGFNQVVSDWREYKHSKKETSVGDRIYFHQYAYKVFMKNPWVGQGVAGFMTCFDEEKPMPERDRPLLEPHSQYWLIASEFGLIGLGLWVLFIGSLLRTSLQLTPNLRNISLAMLLSFCVGNLSDSLFFYSGSGYFFILFIALCFGELFTARS